MIKLEKLCHRLLLQYLVLNEDINYVEVLIKGFNVKRYYKNGGAFKKK